MKPCQAAALALVGWYMMMPPPDPLDRLHANFDAPLSQWRISRAFDNAEDCNNFRDQWQDYAKRKNLSSRMQDAAAFSQCVASDDPRLKGKSPR
jgi:hypothetical protein